MSSPGKPRLIRILHQVQGGGKTLDCITIYSSVLVPRTVSVSASVSQPNTISSPPTVSQSNPIPSPATVSKVSLVPASSTVSEPHPIPRSLLLFTPGASRDIHSPRNKAIIESFAENGTITVFNGSGHLSEARYYDFILVIDNGIGGHAITVIGGRSSGAIGAVKAAGERPSIIGLVCFSPPITRNGVPEDINIWMKLEKGLSILIIIGGNDKLCDLEEVRKLISRLREKGLKCYLMIVESGDHALKVPGGTEDVRYLVGGISAQWVKEVNAGTLDERKMLLMIYEEEKKSLSTGWKSDEGMSEWKTEHTAKKSEKEHVLKPQKGRRTKKVTASEEEMDVDDGMDTEGDDDVDNVPEIENQQSAKARVLLERSAKSKGVLVSDNVSDNDDEMDFEFTESSKARNPTKRKASSSKVVQESDDTTENNFGTDIQLASSSKWKMSTQKSAKTNDKKATKKPTKSDLSSGTLDAFLTPAEPKRPARADDDPGYSAEPRVQKRRKQ